LYLPHVLESAWDWKFRSFPECLVTLTLKDGSHIYGWCGAGSFIGSDPKDRDIYLSQVYDVDETGTWTIKTPGKGVYIVGGEVRIIEFIPIISGDAA
jgi:hypothetical protein